MLTPILFFSCAKPLQFFPSLKGATFNGQLRQRFQRGRCTKVASTLSHDGRQMELSRRCIKVLKDKFGPPVRPLCGEDQGPPLCTPHWLADLGGIELPHYRMQKPLEMSYEFPEFAGIQDWRLFHLLFIRDTHPSPKHCAIWRFEQIGPPFVPNRQFDPYIALDVGAPVSTLLIPTFR